MKYIRKKIDMIITT